MILAEEISRYGSVAVAGLAKNVGKTVTLNYLLREGYKTGLRPGVTSIGVDGESKDRVSGTLKPEITIGEGTIFATSETHYRIRRLQSEVLALGERQTSLGKTVMARALSRGKVLLSGPADTTTLRNLISAMRQKGAGTVLVDGALSRVSLASPVVTEAMVLATGAALSPDISRIVNQTAFLCSLTEIPEADKALADAVRPREDCILSIDSEGVAHDPGVTSVLDLEKVKDKIFAYGQTIYVPGMITDRFLRFLTSQKEAANVTLIIRDFTRLFVEPATLKAFQRRGGEIRVLRRSKLLAVTYNPFSPNGFSVDRDRLGDALQDKLNVPVIYIDPDCIR